MISDKAMERLRAAEEKKRVQKKGRKPMGTRTKQTRKITLKMLYIAN